MLLDVGCYPAELATSLKVTETRRRYELSLASHYPNTLDGSRQRMLCYTASKRDNAMHISKHGAQAYVRTPLEYVET